MHARLIIDMVFGLTPKLTIESGLATRLGLSQSAVGAGPARLFLLVAGVFVRDCKQFLISIGPSTIDLDG